MATKASAKLRRKERSESQYGILEPRQMMAGDTGLAVQADLNEVFATVEDPLVVRLGQFDRNTTHDAAILSSSGQLTIASNGGDDTWQTRSTVDLGTGPLQGMELALVNDDPWADLVLQGPDNLFIALNDGQGNFSVSQSLTPFAAGDLGSSSSSPLRIVTNDFNGDAKFDIAAIAPGSDQLAIYLGRRDGTFSAPIVESTGGTTPTTIVAGDFIGDAFPDFAIGHADGTVTFVQNQQGTTFALRDDLTVSGFNSVTDLVSADIDQDGDADIVVASRNNLSILKNERVETIAAPGLANGSFSGGLSAWNVEVVGQPDASATGTVIAQSGFAQLVENQSFLVSVNQEFVVPAAAETIELDILALGLEDPAGGIPDAFEISILDNDGNSLVPTFRPDATSFFNANPGNGSGLGGDANGGTNAAIVTLATGVTWDGETVSVDISAIAPGTVATIFLDLIGNGPGTRSTATIDNIRVTPQNVFDHSFSPATLAGPFVNVNQVIVADVDGDQRPDIVATDAGAGRLLVFNGKGELTFEREEIDLSVPNSPGTGLVSLDAAPLTAGDGVSDIALIAQGGSQLISPLADNATINAPVISGLSPVSGFQDAPVQLSAMFSDVPGDAGGTYSAVVTWGDGSTSFATVAFDDGSGVGTITAEHTYTATGTFTLTIQLTDPEANEVTATTTSTISPVVIGTGVWLQPIDFDTDAAGNGLSKGQVITDQWSAWGVHITTHDPINHPAMIFDSANPSGGDLDLGTPNASFGGPGQGHGGSSSSPWANSIAQQNILIISEDGDASDPDDLASGGTLIFNFDNPVMLDEIRLLDIDGGESALIRLFNSAGNLISVTSVAGSESNNGFSIVDLSADNVSRMEVALTGSGAITDLIFCRDPQATGDTVITGSPSVDEGQGFDLNLQTSTNDIADWVIDWGDGITERIEASGGSNGNSIIATHVFADGDARRSIVAQAIQNNGTVHQSSPLGVQVNNVDPVLTITPQSTVDSATGVATVKAGQAFRLNLRSVDPGSDSISHWVIDWGDGSDPQVVPGNPDSVDHIFAAAGDFDVSAEAYDEDSPAIVQDDRLTIRARGSEGGEQFEVLISGEVVGTYTVTTQWQNFQVETDQPTDASQVRIQFVNDFWDPANGIDNNLIVDHVRINDTIYQTESADVFSTGTWAPADGVQPGFRRSQWMHANGYFQFAAIFDPAAFLPYVSNSVSVNVTTPDIPENLWLPTIDFERAADRTALTSGDVIAEQFASLGVHVTTSDPQNHPAMIFDSANPTGGDLDLGTPNQAFGGPGQGHGGQGNENGAGINDQSRGNILIISEDGDTSDPDDNYSGGTLIFTFDDPVMLDEIGLLDIDASEASLRLYDSAGNLIQERAVSGYGNNSYQTVVLDARNVSRLEITFNGSGGVTDLVFCRDASAIQAPPTRFFTVDGRNDSGFEYSANGEQLATFDLVGGSIARGVTTTPTGNPVWVVKSNEWVFVYDRIDNSFLGKWDAVGPEWARGIATDGDDIWIADAKYDRIYQYDGGAAWTNGQHAASQSFKLHGNNRNPSGLAWFDGVLYVTDASSDRVFIYNQTGQHLGNWSLDSANGRSSGITTDVSGQHLWVTDKDDGTIYYYESAAARRSGQQSASSQIQLSANNARPEGIADPAIPINLDQVVTGAITTAGEVVEYTFSGIAGQKIYSDVLSGDLRIGWSLTSPNGDFVFSPRFFQDNGVVELPDDGQYLLRVGSTGNSVTDNFSFQLVNVPAPVPQSLELDTVVTGQRSTPGQELVYTFDGIAGQDLYFDSQDGDVALYWRLLDPAGNEMFNWFFQDRRAAELPVDGQYTLIVGNGSSNTLGNFSFRVWDIPETTVVPITFGQPVNGSITAPTQQQSFRFDGLAGQRVFVDVVSEESFFFGLSVTAPSGAVISNTALLDAGLLTLTEDGPHVITVSANNDRLIDVELVVYDSSPIGPINLPLNVATSATTSPRQTLTYQFSGTAGSELVLDVQTNVGRAVLFEIIAPSGATLVTPTRGDRAIGLLTETGVYTVNAITDAQGVAGLNYLDVQGEFAFRIQEVPVPVSTGQSDNQRDSQGTEFWFAFTPATKFPTPLPQDLSVRISSEVDTVAVISVAEIGFISAVDVTAGEVQRVNIPIDAIVSGDLEDAISNHGIQLVSASPVTVQVVQDAEFSSDGYLAHPVDALGTDFVVLDYFGQQAFSDGEAQFVIVAAQDGTDVTITPAVDTLTRTAGVPYTITLNQGQTYRLAVEPGFFDPAKDLTGTTISSTLPISVLAGSTASFIPSRVRAADMLVEQLPSTDTWGTSFYSLPFATRTGGDTFRFLAATDNTFVSVNGQNVAQLDRGEYFETIIDGPAAITSSQPILVGQYANSSDFDGQPGDPSFLIVDAFEQAKNQYAFATGISGIDQHYVNVIINQADAATLLIDGQQVDATLFTTVATGASGQTFIGARIPVGEGTHRLTADAPFSATVYGFGDFDSYAYSAGTGLASVAEAASLTLLPETVTLSPGQTQTLTARVLNTDGQPVVSVRVDFRVTGVNAQNGFAYTDQNGNASFTWTGANAGVDAVTAFVGALNDSASVNWQTLSPSVTITTPGSAGASGSSESYRDGQTISISGRAIPGSVDAPIVSVTVNGQPVRSLDSAGNYFGLIEVQAGSTVFEVIATDRFGNTATASISVRGNTPGDVNFDQFSRVAPGDGTFRFANTTFNRSTGQLWFDYTITSTGQTRLSPGTHAGFTGFSPSSVFANPGTGARPGTTTTIGQAKTFLQAALIDAGGLAAGQTTDATRLSFSNVDRQRFEFESFLLAPQNSAPVFESAPVTVATVGQEFTYDIVANDLENDAITFSLASGPQAMTVNAATGAISWTPAADDIANHAIAVIADDGQGGVTTQSFVLTVTPPAPVNRAPLFISTPTTTFNLGTDAAASGTFTYAAAALDSESDSLSFALTQNPTGMTVDPLSGLVTWNVDAANIGSHDVTLEVTDTVGNRTMQSFQLDIVAVAPASISGVVFEDANADATLQPGETGLVGRTVYLDANQNGHLDAGELSQTTAADGSFSFTGLMAGSYAVGQVLQTGFAVTAPQNATAQISVTAGQNITGVNFANQINGVTGQSAPEITSSPELFAKVDADYRYQITATDADGDTLRFTLLDGPQGMTVDPDSGLVAWLPTAEQQQSARVLVQVDDGNGNVDVQAFTLFVKPQFEAPAFVTSPGRYATLDELFSYDADVIDGDDLESIVFDLASGPDGATVNRQTGVVTWTPTGVAALADNVQFTVTATDGAGQVAVQGFLVDVRQINTAPVFQSEPVTEVTIGANYIYHAFATDAQDDVRYSLVTPVDGVTVNGRTGAITANRVSAAFEYIVRATDDRGQFTDQSVSVELVADTQSPDVSIVVQRPVDGAPLLTDGSGFVIGVGTSVVIQVIANDNVAVGDLQVSVDGVPYTLDSKGEFVYPATTPGIPVVTAIASDDAGNVSTVTERLRVIDPQDTTAPEASINSPATGEVVTYLSDITATVSSDGDLFAWTVDFSPAGLNQWTVLATGDTDIAGQVVARFDPTLLANGSYDIRIAAEDFSGNRFTIAETIDVDGQAKLGNFTTEFTDLQIPLAGIPINITRQYDTLNANVSGDFGYGWRLSIGDADLRESVPVTAQESSSGTGFFSNSNPFFVGARVFLTTPEGQRVSFRFDPVAETSLLGTRWTPRFVSVDSDYTLEVPDIPLSQTADGFFGLYLLGGLSYNPSQYTLVSRDQIRYQYDQFEGLQSVSDRNGVTLDYRQDGIFSSTGQSIQFVRDSQGRITEIIDPMGNSIRYGYDAAGDLISYTDQVDNTWTHGYNANVPHFLEKVTGPRGNVLQEVRYDRDGRFVALVDALGNAIEQAFDVENNSFTQQDRNGNTTTLEFDDRGNITRETDALGGTTLYQYDDVHNPRLETAITDANGNTTRYTYDARGNVTLLEQPGSVFTRFEYDSFNNVTREFGPFAAGEEATARVTEFRYDANGNLIETIDAVGNSSFQTNDQYGRPLTITDRRGNTTSLEYGQLIASPTRVINPDLSTQTFTYDSFGRPLTQTNELGVITTTVVYDDLGRQLSVSGADGQLTTYVYDGDLLASETVTINATDGQTTTYEYDDNNRLFRQTDANGGVVQLTYDAQGNTTSLTDPVGNTTTYVFDALNRQVQETDPLGAITSYAYDAVGNLTEKVDRLNRRIEFQYDAMDRQNAELWYLADGTLIETSSYTYDIFSNLLTASDAESSYAYTYDALDRLITSDNAGTPDAPNVILTYSYDVDGNRTGVADNSGVTIDSEYGSRNELLSRTWFGGEVDDARIEYSYDDALRETEARRYSDTNGTTRIGRTETAYDDSGRRVRITHLDGSDIVLANYEYEFDQANRITQQTIDNDVVDYTYDLTGQLLTADHSDPSIPDEFYQYDLNGNRIASHLHGNDYVTGPNNQLLSDGEFNYEYDDEGNQIRRTNIATGEITEFEYDHRNRLVRTTVKTSGGIITSESQYVFDVFGRRIAVINDADGAGPGEAVRENFVYDGDNVWGDYNEAGAAIARYLFGDNIDSNIARWRAGEGTAWYLTDHLGTVRVVIDALGLLQNQTIYDSFGQVLAETNALFGDRFKFTGRELNSGSDYYYRARQYNASQGRFGSLDSIGFSAGDSNLFRYVGNSLLNFTDPTGNVTATEYAALLFPFAATVAFAGTCFLTVIDNNPDFRIRDDVNAEFRESQPGLRQTRRDNRASAGRNAAAGVGLGVGGLAVGALGLIPNLPLIFVAVPGAGLVIGAGVAGTIICDNGPNNG